MVIIYMNFVEPEYKRLNAKFHDHRTISFVGEDFLIFFYNIWVWRPSWLFDLDHLYRLCFPLHNEASHIIWL